MVMSRWPFSLFISKCLSVFPSALFPLHLSPVLETSPLFQIDFTVQNTSLRVDSNLPACPWFSCFLVLRKNEKGINNMTQVHQQRIHATNNTVHNTTANNDRSNTWFDKDYTGTWLGKKCCRFSNIFLVWWIHEFSHIQMNTLSEVIQMTIEA